MNWIDSHSRVDEGFAYDLVLVACSQHSSAFTRSVFCCVQNTKVGYYVFLQTQGRRQVSGNILQQVEKLKYLGVVFTSGESRSEEVDTRVGKANAVLREFIAL